MGVAFDIDRGFLGLDEELTLAADAEGVIRSLGGAADLDRGLVDDILVFARVPLFVEDIPTQCPKERI